MEENKINNNKIKTSFFWKFAEKFCAQGISFFISIMLARILVPEDYGVVSIVITFITLANVLVSSGLGTALIQKKDAKEEDFSTMFFCNLMVAIFLYLLLYIFAPSIANFYGNEELKIILRVLALKLPIASINSIQHAYVSKHMAFEKFFFSTIIGTIISGIIGIEMAYKGFGVWALVAQNLISSIMNTIILVIIIPWKPKLQFSKKTAKELIGYGSKVTIAQFISAMYIELRSLIIGKIYTVEDLAYYKKGNAFPDLFINNIDSAMGSVLFPAMSNYNDKISQIKILTKKSLRMSAYIIFPIMIGLIVVAEPLIRILLTDKWLAAIPFMQIYCIAQMTMPISTANIQVIKAVGRSDLFLKMEVLKKIIGIIIILLVMKISVKAVAISSIIYAIIATFINIYPNRKLINYGYKEQIKDIIVPCIMSVIMGTIAYFILFLNLSGVSTIILQIIVGLSIYLGLSYILKVEEFNIIKKLLVDVREKNGRKNVEKN